MKRIIYYLAFCLLLLGRQASGQVIDLSTGILDNSFGVLINDYEFDDTWMVQTTTSTTFQPVRCGNGICAGTVPPAAYPGRNTSIKWLSPFTLPNGSHTTGAIGDYYYRMTFNLPAYCSLTSAIITFNHIGGDNMINQMQVNSTPYSVSYGFSPFGSGTHNVTSALVPGQNEIILRLNSFSNYTGLEIRGSLAITATYADAGFCFSSNGTSITATPNSTGSHSWEVYSSATGNVATFTPVGTFTTPTLALNGTGLCYYIKHTVSNSCGTFCEAQYTCNKECTETELCNLPAPKNVKFNQVTNTFSWDPVAGASRYVIEILPNDPACCQSLQHGTQLTKDINAAYASYLWERPTNIRCFSWRLKVMCANGSFVASETKCQIIDPSTP